MEECSRPVMEETEDDFNFRKLGNVSKHIILCGERKRRKKRITRRIKEEELLLVLSVKQRTQSSSHSFLQ